MRGGKREGAGRPVGTKKDTHVEYQTISLSGKPEEIRKLKEQAQAENKTVSRYVLESLIK